MRFKMMPTGQDVHFASTATINLIRTDMGIPKLVVEISSFESISQLEADIIRRFAMSACCLP
jgi:hypothetical protein